MKIFVETDGRSDTADAHCLGSTAHAFPVRLTLMRKLIATLSLALSMLLGSAGVSASSNFWTGLDAYQSGDYATALREWKSSAELANANSMLMLGVMYEKGQGVPQDYIHAHMWLNLAESSGSVAAGNRRDVVARKMTPSQIEKAEVLAYKCVRKGFKGC